MFRVHATVSTSTRTFHSLRDRHITAHASQSIDFAPQKRKRLSWMPRLLENDRAKHNTEDVSTWQRERQAYLSSVETVRFGDGCFVGDGTEIFAERGRAVTLGDGSRVAANCFIHGPCDIGSRTSVNAGCHIEGGSAGVKIGDDTRIGPNFSAFAFNHVFEDATKPIREQGVTSEGIVIGVDCWLGANVSVTDGVTIGDHAVVGIGSVVTKDVEPWSVVAGNPARVIRHRKRPNDVA
jgi:acetyltransferase-like isoleucine patch superfamily enzyme